MGGDQLQSDVSAMDLSTSLLSTSLLSFTLIALLARPAHTGTGGRTLKCRTDADCVTTSHSRCCVDVSDLPRQDKSCCSSPHSVIWPDNINNLTSTQLAHLDTAIASLAPVFMDGVVCQGLEYHVMDRLSSCREFLTTTARIQQMPQTDLAMGLSSSSSSVTCLAVTVLSTRL